MKTLEEKRLLFLDMQEHPENYSDKELQAMLDDPEMKGDMACFDALRQIATHESVDVTDEDIADEWRKLTGEQNKAVRKTFILRPLRVAAIFIGCLLMIGVAYATIRIIKEREPMPIAESIGTESNKAQIPTETKTIKTENTVEPTDSIVKFNDAELETVINTMAEHYAVKTNFKTDSARHIRLFFIWNKNTSLADVIEVLNGYDRINVALIDNTLTVK